MENILDIDSSSDGEDYNQLLTKYHSLKMSYVQLRNDYESNERYREEHATLERDSLMEAIKQLNEKYTTKIKYLEEHDHSERIKIVAKLNKAEHERDEMQNILDLFMKLATKFNIDKSSTEKEFDVSRLNYLIKLNDSVDIRILDHVAKIIEVEKIINKK